MDSSFGLFYIFFFQFFLVKFNITYANYGYINHIQQYIIINRVLIVRAHVQLIITFKLQYIFNKERIKKNYYYFLYYANRSEDTRVMVGGVQWNTLRNPNIIIREYYKNIMNRSENRIKKNKYLHHIVASFKKKKKKNRNGTSTKKKISPPFGTCQETSLRRTHYQQIHWIFFFYE